MIYMCVPRCIGAWWIITHAFFYIYWFICIYVKLFVFFSPSNQIFKLKHARTFNFPNYLYVLLDISKQTNLNWISFSFRQNVWTLHFFCFIPALSNFPSSGLCACMLLIAHIGTDLSALSGLYMATRMCVCGWMIASARSRIVFDIN